MSWRVLRRLITRPAHISIGKDYASEVGADIEEEYGVEPYAPLDPRGPTGYGFFQFVTSLRGYRRIFMGGRRG